MRSRFLKIIKSSITVLAVIALALSLSSPAMAKKAKRIKWKVPLVFKQVFPGLGTNVVYAAKQIKAITRGRIALRIYDPPKLIKGFEILDAVSSGKFKAGYTWIGYDAGKISSLPLFSAAPFGMEPWEFTAWNYFKGGDKLLNKVYKSEGKKVHAILCGIMGPETAGWYRKPIKKLSDYNGLKIRFAGLGGRVLSKLGASVTMMPAGDLKPALEKGTIDATEFSMPKIDQLLAFHKVVKHNVFPGWHQTFTAMHLLVNKGAWKRLSKSDKVLFETTCKAATLNGLSEGEAAQGEVIVGSSKLGVTSHSLPVAVLKELKRVTEQVLQEEANKDKNFKMVLEHQNKFRKEYSHWKRLGYLPRDF